MPIGKIFKEKNRLSKFNIYISTIKLMIKKQLKIIISFLILTVVTLSCEKDSISEPSNSELNSVNIEGSKINDASKGKEGKISICHYAGKDYNWSVININENAVPGHEKHGDVVLVDADSDGYVEAVNECVPGGDCNDSDATVNPGATEVAYDGIDNDCDPATLDDDLDQDGFVKAIDCNDNDATVNPGATEVEYDGIDNDCDPATLDQGNDLDKDGFVKAADCDDSDANINPGATEVVDGIDNNCDGLIDIGAFHEGGVVFHIFVDGEPGYVVEEIHGLVSAIEDLPKSKWGCYGALIDGTRSEIGTGQGNTAAIVRNSCHMAEGITDAAEACDNYNEGMYDDWFLPSKEELNEMWLNHEAINTTATENGGSNFNKIYWSSTTRSDYSAYIQFLDLGYKGTSTNNQTQHVRAVRAF